MERGSLHGSGIAALRPEFSSVGAYVGESPTLLQRKVLFKVP